MKISAMLSLILVVSSAECVSTQVSGRKGAMLELNRIVTVTLAPSYSCRTSAESTSGYGNTALFLSNYSKRINGPDLLFNGACKSDDYFQASMAGDDMALIADLGSDVVLEDLTTQEAFNTRRVFGYENESKFVEAAKVVVGHTYAVLLNKARVRGLIVLTVIGHEPNKSVTIRYAVKQYQIHNTVGSSDGFAWDAPSYQ